MAVAAIQYMTVNAARVVVGLILTEKNDLFSLRSARKKIKQDIEFNFLVRLRKYGGPW